MKKKQRGGFGLGLIVGLLIGLALALGVALYVTKVPIPFVNKVPPRAAERDADERERNRNWDPNGPLHGSNPARPVTPPPPAAPAAPPAAREAAAADADRTPAADPAAPPPGVAQTPPPRDPAQPPPAAPAPAATGNAESNRQATAIFSDRPAPAADAGLSTRPRDDPFIYFVQAGAFGRPEDAEQQRARLAMLGTGIEGDRARAGRAHRVPGAHRTVRQARARRRNQGPACRCVGRGRAGAGPEVNLGRSGVL